MARVFLQSLKREREEAEDASKEGREGSWEGEGEGRWEGRGQEGGTHHHRWGEIIFGQNSSGVGRLQRCFQVPASEMSRDQLEGHVRRLQEELQRERDERNFYQLERDRIDTFWEVTRRELEETRAEVRVKDR